MWTQSIAIGSETFVSGIKKKMESLAIGRSIKQIENCCELRENEFIYNCLFGVKNGDIGQNNAYFWNINSTISAC